jgi:SNF2 family DNA or RNA helicase
MAAPSSSRFAPAGLEPGDRFEVTPIGETGRLGLPRVLGPDGFPIEQIEDPAGRPLDLALDASAGSIVVPKLAEGVGRSSGPLWLEYRAPGRFRLIVEPGTPHPANGSIVTEQGVPIEFDRGDWPVVQAASASAAGLELDQLDLAIRAARLATHAGFDRLIALPMVRDIELLEHQIRTAKTVLRRFRGRAMLSDEVGLGKTIEAGLVLSELMVRGLARSVLVLVPPSLIEQWQGEMRRKFSIELVSHDDPAFRDRGPAAWGEFDRVIASIHTAKREPHRAAILARRWDIVIVDEAHHLRNRNTQAWKFASEVQKQFILLLTATPVQNNLEELFNLVTLLEPGLLSTARQFQRHFMDRHDKLTPRHVDELHALLSEVMIRNRRSTVGLQFTRRWARTISLPLSTSEQALYHDVTAFVRDHLRAAQARKEEKAKAKDKKTRGTDADADAAKAGGSINRMALLSLQMAMGSSSRAAAGTLRKIAEQPKLAASDRTWLTDLAERALALHESTKVGRLLGLLDEFGDKLVIFTQFRATQELLEQRLKEAGHAVAVFHGGLSRLGKEAAIDQFRGPARLLLCTEAGSEGRNLQFAHAVCNFDLPWSPMKIEQRIGRLSRIGQTHDVFVFNLVAADTVEAAVLHLLEAKLNMFELVIGEVDMILGNLEDEREFPDVVADLWAESADQDDFAHRIDNLGDRLLEAKRAYFEQRALDDKLFGSRFAPDQ